MKTYCDPIKKYCTFPDQTKVKITSILDVSETYTCIAYDDGDENLPQILWVPNDSITND
jgi:hypothetical protein